MILDIVFKKKENFDPISKNCAKNKSPTEILNTNNIVNKEYKEYIDKRIYEFDPDVLEKKANDNNDNKSGKHSDKQSDKNTDELPTDLDNLSEMIEKKYYDYYDQYNMR